MDDQPTMQPAQMQMQITMQQGASADASAAMQADGGPSAADGLSATDRDLQSPEVARLARQHQQQAEAAAAAAAAVAASSFAAGSGDPKHTSPHRLQRATAGAALADPSAVTSATPWSWTDEHAAAQTAMQLFLDTLDRIRKKNQDATHPTISNEDLLVLHSLFGSDLNKSLQIADNSKVRVHVGTSAAKPFYFRVPGSGGVSYLTTLHHCNCLAYLNQVIVHKTHLMCKHQIAALLADALGRTEALTVADAAIAHSLANMEPARQNYGRAGGRRGSGDGGGSGGGGSGRGGGMDHDGGFFHHH